MFTNVKESLYVILKNDVFLRSTFSPQEALAYQSSGYQVVNLAFSVSEPLLSSWG